MNADRAASSSSLKQLVRDAWSRFNSLQGSFNPATLEPVQPKSDARSLGERVWEIELVRKEVLRALPEGQLYKCLTLSRSTFHDVVLELYISWSDTYQRSLKVNQIAPDRLKLYMEAVRYFHIYRRTMEPWLESYDELKKLFPNLLLLTARNLRMQFDARTGQPVSLEKNIVVDKINSKPLLAPKMPAPFPKTAKITTYSIQMENGRILDELLDSASVSTSPSTLPPSLDVDIRVVSSCGLNLQAALAMLRLRRENRRKGPVDLKFFLCDYDVDAVNELGYLCGGDLLRLCLTVDQQGMILEDLWESFRWALFSRASVMDLEVWLVDPKRSSSPPSGERSALAPKQYTVKKNLDPLNLEELRIRILIPNNILPIDHHKLFLLLPSVSEMATLMLAVGGPLAIHTISLNNHPELDRDDTRCRNIHRYESIYQSRLDEVIRSRLDQTPLVPGWRKVEKKNPVAEQG